MEMDIFEDYMTEMDSVSDGWQSTFEYKEVLKALKWAYNKALEDVEHRSSDPMITTLTGPMKYEVDGRS